jgi:hypothetical protein
MPAASASPTEISLSGATRRRVWAHPEAKSHSLVVLALDRLLAAPLTGAPKPEVVAAAEDGGNLEELLGPLAVAVDLSTVSDVKLDLLTNSLIVEYHQHGTGRLTLVFATAEAADACFSKLWRRLGDGHKLQPYKRDAWAAARAPLLLLGCALVFTAALSLTLSVFEDSATARAAAHLADGAKVLPKSTLEVLLGWMDWRVICALGGAAAAGAQVWLYRRLTRPPVALELKRDSELKRG